MGGGVVAQWTKSTLGSNSTRRRGFARPILLKCDTRAIVLFVNIYLIQQSLRMSGFIPSFMAVPSRNAFTMHMCSLTNTNINKLFPPFPDGTIVLCFNIKF